MKAPARGLRAKWRVVLLALGWAGWTLVSCYPNPRILVRNFARYHRLPVDPKIEQRMGWELPSDPLLMELFVDSLLAPTPDWARYRVPWYVPTPLEAARSLHGDCEAKAVLLASLLAGKGVPYEVRASLNHIWVEYEGRRPRPGERQELAYLEGKGARLRMRWPRRVEWREVIAVQREQLWGPMPLARKALWLVGLTWVGLAALLLGGRAPEGELRSRWKPRFLDYLARAGWLAALAFALIALAPGLRRDAAPVRWSVADLWEVLALSAFSGGLLAWLTLLRPARTVTIEPRGLGLALSSSMGPWRRARGLRASEVTHLLLEASPGGLRPWTISAALRRGEQIALLYYDRELAARQALRRLGLAIGRPLLVRSDGYVIWTMPDEMHLSLRERAAGRPAPPAGEPPGRQAGPPPRGCGLEVGDSAQRWELRFRASGRRPGIALLGMAAVPVIFAGLATLAVLRFPWQIGAWVGWIAGTSLLSLVVYIALVLRGEMVAMLAGARVEIAGGVLRSHTPEGSVEELEVGRIQTVELSRRGETPTVAIVSPEQVVHLRGLCAAEHTPWLRQTVEQAIVRVPES